MENYRMGCSGNRPYNRTCGMNMPQPSNRNMNSSECSVRNTTDCSCTILLYCAYEEITLHQYSRNLFYDILTICYCSLRNGI